MTFYSAMIETRADDGGHVDEAALAAFLDAVEPHFGAVTSGGSPQGWSARVSVEAASAPDAAVVAAGIVTGLAAESGLPAGR